MSEYLSLGPVPADEGCAQVGSDDYYERATEEYARYRNLLAKTFPPPDCGHSAKFFVKWSPHDFGDYAEVYAKFEPSCKECTAWAYDAENNAPESWDAENAGQ